jgi:uncharacterized membrane protein HdeD (DUF308 family)
MSASGDPNAPSGNPAVGGAPAGPTTSSTAAGGSVPGSAAPTGGSPSMSGPASSTTAGAGPAPSTIGGAYSTGAGSASGGTSGAAAGGRMVSDAGMCAVLAENWWAVALRGVFGILFGLIALFATGPTILSLVLFFSAYMLVDGVFGIVSAVRAARQHERWGLLLLEGLADIAAGVIAFLLPGITVIAFVLLMAVWALVSGGLMLGAAFKLDQAHGRWWLALGGVVSILYGLLLAIAPVIGAIVLTWWLGAYALAFGVVLLVLAFRLRARKNQGTGAGTALPQGT